MTELTQDQIDFRQAMSTLAAAVTVITTNGPHGKGGITVSAAVSVTDSPPTMAVFVNQRSAMREVFSSNGVVGINILEGAHPDLALDFAGVTKKPMEERFVPDAWEDRGGVPLLKEAAASLVGCIVDEREIGTHAAYLVEVSGIQVAEAPDGLVYYRRRFHPVEVEPSEPAIPWNFFDEWADPFNVTHGAASHFDERAVTGALPIQKPGG